MNEETKSLLTDEVEYKFSTDWIYKLENEVHWRLYWKQQDIMHKKISTVDRILEIGVGSAFTSNYLKSKGFNVLTIDIDKDKKPDIVANIVDFQFSDSFDHILAYEIFEHIPLNKFKQILKRLHKTVDKNIFLSVPKNERVWIRTELFIPKLGKKILQLTSRIGKVIWKHHFWEIDSPNLSKKEFDLILQETGFTIEHSEKYLSKYFYVLKK